MEITIDSIRDQIPYYLTQEQKVGLVRALKDFPENIQYYLSGYQDELLQGDGWTKLQIVLFETMEKVSSQGIVLSNTCDVALENKRTLPVKITFAPIIPLAAYIQLLKANGFNATDLHNKLDAIRKQKVSTIFYLPAGGALTEEHIALFDDLHTMPVNVFEAEKAKSKLFTLSLVGFYLFLLKLSVHFCRFHENVARA